MEASRHAAGGFDKLSLSGIESDSRYGIETSETRKGAVAETPRPIP